jgi:hypothetical protein
MVLFIVGIFRLIGLARKGYGVLSCHGFEIQNKLERSSFRSLDFHRRRDRMHS